jgi:hypothetical protein
MHLFKVTIVCKKSWMAEEYELKWAVVADTPEGALEQVLDEYDLGGVEIIRTIAKKIESGIIAL